MSDPCDGEGVQVSISSYVTVALLILKLPLYRDLIRASRDALLLAAWRAECEGKEEEKKMLENAEISYDLRAKELAAEKELQDQRQNKHKLKKTRQNSIGTAVANSMLNSLANPLPPPAPVYPDVNIGTITTDMDRISISNDHVQERDTRSNKGGTLQSSLLHQEEDIFRVSDDYLQALRQVDSESHTSLDSKDENNNSYNNIFKDKERQEKSISSMSPIGTVSSSSRTKTNDSFSFNHIDEQVKDSQSVASVGTKSSIILNSNVKSKEEELDSESHNASHVDGARNVVHDNNYGHDIKSAAPHRTNSVQSPPPDTPPDGDRVPRKPTSLPSKSTPKRNQSAASVSSETSDVAFVTTAAVPGPESAPVPMPVPVPPSTSATPPSKEPARRKISAQALRTKEALFTSALSTRQPDVHVSSDSALLNQFRTSRARSVADTAASSSSLQPPTAHENKGRKDKEGVVSSIRKQVTSAGEVSSTEVSRTPTRKSVNEEQLAPQARPGMLSLTAADELTNKINNRGITVNNSTSSHVSTHDNGSVGGPPSRLSVRSVPGADAGDGDGGDEDEEDYEYVYVSAGNLAGSAHTNYDEYEEEDDDGGDDDQEDSTCPTVKHSTIRTNHVPLNQSIMQLQMNENDPDNTEDEYALVSPRFVFLNL